MASPDNGSLDGLLRLPRTRAAIAYAERLHAGQRRGVDGAPFIVHPLEVASLLCHAACPDRVVAAGALHDIIEKTDTDAAQLQGRFGLPITMLVLAVSENKHIAGYAERKRALRRQAARAGEEALMVLAADKISKVRELRLEIAQRGQQFDQVRIQRDRRFVHYRRCLGLLEELLNDCPLVGQLRGELGAITPLRAPGPAAQSFELRPQAGR